MISNFQLPYIVLYNVFVSFTTLSKWLNYKITNLTTFPFPEHQKCLVLIPMKVLLITALICLIISPNVLCTLSPSSKGGKKSKDKELKVKTGPIGESVFDRGLLDDEPSSKSILIENGAYFKDTSLRHFNNTILGYVTPVNSKSFITISLFNPPLHSFSGTITATILPRHSVPSSTWSPRCGCRSFARATCNTS